MKKKSLLTIFAFILWSAFCTFFYVNKIRCFNIFSEVKPEKSYKNLKSNIVETLNNNRALNTDTILKITINFNDKNIKPDINYTNDSLIELVYDFYINTNKIIYIKGYSNITKNQNENYKKGRIRAWVVKSILLEKGIKSEFLITSAKNSSEDNKVEISSENN